MSVALNLARRGRVHIITKKDLTDSNTNLAQGGIASVLGADDSFALHAADTIEAGCGLSRTEVVDIVIQEGPDRIRDLMSLGVPFTTEDGELSLGLEGGHSRKRIVHSDDLTGRAVEHRLLEAVLANDNIEVFPYHMAVNLIESRHLDSASSGSGAVWGAYALDTRRGVVETFASRRTLLATGGAGKVYLYTTNPDIATGDGIAMAYRAGARITNLEFVQFHPTCLYHPDAKSFLLSEALRGEGGRLLRSDGDAFMHRYHEKKDLAPRDVVARAIDTEMKHSGDVCVFLDVTHLDHAFIERRFPNIFSRCADLGIDIRSEPIPVVPATHYFCGGVDVDTWGRTGVENLLALGEVSHTGLHGANRLASNSLLEALVFARRTHDGALMDFDNSGAPPVARPWEPEGSGASPEAVILEHDWDETRRIMWDYVGIVRSERRLKIAKRRLRAMRETVAALYWNSQLTQDLIELRNIVLIGELIVQSALARRESRGLHYNESYPERDDATYQHDSVLTIGAGDGVV